MQSTGRASITLSVISQVSRELDDEFQLTPVDIHSAGLAKAPLLDPVKDCFLKLKEGLDHAIVLVRIHGREIIDRLVFDFEDTFRRLTEGLEDGLQRVISGLEDLLDRWRSKLYEHAMRNLPRRIVVNEGSFVLATVEVTRSLKLQAGVKPSVTSLLEFIAAGDISMKTQYDWHEAGNEDLRGQ